MNAVSTRRQLLTVLGSTGSIGVNTLDVVARHPERYRIFALTAHRQIERVAAQCKAFSPRFCVVPDEPSARALSALLRESGVTTEVCVGQAALEEVASAPEVDVVMAAIVGAAGLAPTLAAARAGKKILLANKEALVMAGQVFLDAVRAHGARLLPIDSEHNAVFQSLPHDFSGDLPKSGVRRIVLTASGGPFRTTPREALAAVTPDQACAHPNWRMGRKISVDSATMMNKGLEVIEACLLFDAPPQQVEVVIHPQSVIHSMVEYRDGSVIAQLGNPDMRTPIAHALAWPERIDAGVSSLDLCRIGQLDFEAVDTDRFPCLQLAYRALAEGGGAPTVLNAANEIAVEAFLAGRLAFLDIPEIISATLGAVSVSSVTCLEAVLQVDESAREWAARHVASRARAVAHTPIS
jgi:1-deoxy-D-xylulose-5-phosphate reductoisomerase